MKNKAVHDLTGLRPVTPDSAGFFTATPEVDQLRAENRKLRQQLAYERSKHEKIENAIARHISNLEKTLSNSRSSIEVLSTELVRQLGEQMIPKVSKR
jgi:predicted RNase H-like nuclease (RuvC/YqgF family)